MDRRSFLNSVRAFGAVIALLLSIVTTHANSSDALTGQVTSDAEGKMEGVLVIAQHEGSGVLTSVVSDTQGRYRFPRSHLEAGKYKITIRAVGYVLPEGSVSSSVDSARTVELNLHLNQATNDQLAHQLTNTDWWTSIPGKESEKAALIRKVVNCGTCHDVERIARSPYTADQFMSPMRRMSTYVSDNTSGCGTGSVFSCDVQTRGHKAAVARVAQEILPVCYRKWKSARSAVDSLTHCRYITPLSYPRSKGRLTRCHYLVLLPTP